MNHYPIDDSELLCAAKGCDNPYPCAQHQAFEAAACAPPFLLCNHGSSDAPRAGCTSAERCTAAGKCLAPLPALPPPPPTEDDDQTRQDAPPAEVYPDRALDQQPEQTMRAALQQLIQAAEAGEPRQLSAAIDNARRFL